MGEFAYQLSRELKRPVFDKTGIAGAFDFTLALRDGTRRLRRSRAVHRHKETMGLKLESAKGPVEILIIDHIEKAHTEN
jgi:uncharacterized protein (TIGR03435 family)